MNSVHEGTTGALLGPHASTYPLGFERLCSAQLSSLGISYMSPMAACSVRCGSWAAHPSAHPPIHPPAMQCRHAGEQIKTPALAEPRRRRAAHPNKHTYTKRPLALSAEGKQDRRQSSVGQD